MSDPSSNTGYTDRIRKPKRYLYMLRFQDELVGLSSKISETCDTEDSGALFLMVTTTTVQGYLCGINNLVRDFRELVGCRNIYPLYEQAMHQTFMLCWIR
mmetsp:Transcript_28679/g.69579  ORF Transcript_28679/g.69579 Transcript_28679/m.69579 type:complete len:100 (+) Transcript_28679:451-750(+)